MNWIPILALVLLSAGRVPGSGALDYIQTRGGCPNAFRKFNGNQTPESSGTVTFLGGSITEGAGASQPQFCYRERLMSHLRVEFPGVALSEVNAALGGTGSWLGAFRTAKDVLYGGTDLVFVEFAVDDAGVTEAEAVAAMEGIVRQIISRDASTDLVFLYTLSRAQLEAYRQGTLPEPVAWHEKIAAHYGLPSVNLGRYAAEKLQRGALTFEEFTKDGVHPTDRGYALYFEALSPFIAGCRAEAARGGNGRRHVLGSPLSPAPMDQARCVPYEWAGLTSPWKVGQRSPTENLLHVLTSDNPEGLLTLDFKGAQVGMLEVIGPDSGDYEVSIDGGAWKRQAGFDEQSRAGFRTHASRLANGLVPDQPHQLRLRVAAARPEASQGRTARLGYLLVDGTVEDPFRGLPPMMRIDSLWSTMDPLRYEPPPGRWRHLEKTRQRLAEGGALRIVMLGDSIMEDTAASGYELLLEQMYPRCKVKRVVSARGSTGCWWYKDQNRVQSWVLRHRPDLLMIGGISQRNDTESIRAVIRQVRTHQPTEVLLMTPAFGRTQDIGLDQWTYEITSAGNDYRARLLRLAEEEECGFIDMTGPWWQYIKDSGKDYGWFRRDAVHANERGSQILGRVLERFFAP